MRRTLSRAALVVLVAAGVGCDTTPPPMGVSALPGLGVMVGGAANLARGASTTVAITVARMGDFTGPVDLLVTGLPDGVTGTFAPAPVPAGSTTSVLTLSASATATLGTATATVAVGPTAAGIGTAGVGNTPLTVVVTQ